MSSFYDTTDDWRRVRFDHIEQHYPVDHFRGKTVLEVAAAWGHIGAHFHNQYGAIVTCTDYYDEWVKIIKERHPYITTQLQDLNEPWSLTTPFDVIIHMGVIYHQPPDIVEPRLREALANCKEMIIETIAEVSDDPHLITRVDPPTSMTWEPLPMIVDYSRPSVAFINRILTDMGFTWTEVMYNTPYTDETHTEARFLWFCQKS